MAANPDCAYNYVGLGALDLLNNQPGTAGDYFKKAQNLGKKNYEILVDIARAYYNADPVKYAKEITKYLEKAHKDSKHGEPSIYILEGDMLFDAKDYGAAAGKYEMAIGYDNNNPEGYVKYARAYFPVNPQFSIQKLEEFLQVAPNSALGQRELAEKYYEANYWNKAAEQYGTYIQNPNHFPEDKERYSVLLYYGEKYPESLRVANEVLAQNPGSFLMQRLRYLNQDQLGQYAEAAANAADFFKNNPNGRFTPNDYLVYANSLKQLGQDSLAVVQMEAGVARFPEDGNMLKELSSVYTSNKDYAKAADTYARYLATLEKPSVNDYFSASGRYLNVAATAGDNQELRADAAKKGLDFVEKAIANAQPNPLLLQRKARLQIAANNSNPNAESIATYNDMIAMLDQDPANADPANPNNNLQLYKEAYLFSVKYYTDIEPDKDKAAAASEALKAVNEKLG